jgi:hypothetical protein
VARPEVIVLPCLGKTQHPDPPSTPTCTHPATNLLQVRVVLRAVRYGEPDGVPRPVGQGAVLVLCEHRIPLSKLAYVANREGGPFQQSVHDPVKRVFPDEI